MGHLIFGHVYNITIIIILNCEVKMENRIYSEVPVRQRRSICFKKKKYFFMMLLNKDLQPVAVMELIAHICTKKKTISTFFYCKECCWLQ